MSRCVTVRTERKQIVGLSHFFREWTATLEPHVEGGPTGYGPTEHDAVCSLYIEIAEREAEEEERELELRDRS